MKKGTVIILAFSILLLSCCGKRGQNDSLKVPDIVGLQQETAQKTVEEAGLVFQITGLQNSNIIPKDCVLTQDPSAGSEIGAGAAINVVISDGPEVEYVPNLLDKLKEAAVAELEKLGFKVEITEEFGDATPGAVLRQDPVPETALNKGDTVKLVISKGLEGMQTGLNVTVPALIGKDFNDAKALLIGMGLYIVKGAEIFSDTIPVGQIAAQKQAAGGNAQTGQTISVTVSLGKEKVRVPDVRHKTEDAAKKLLTAAKLTVEVVYEGSVTVAKGNVIRQSVAYGSRVEMNFKVVITVSLGVNPKEEAPSVSSKAASTPVGTSSSPASSVASAPPVVQDLKTPCIVETKYATDDVVIADVVATNSQYGADNTGNKDSTTAIKTAINACSASGGGTVWLPAGKYKITSSISIPAFVTLRGDYQDPDVGSDYGTIIMADVPTGSATGSSLFNLSGSGGVMGLTIYYPNQDIDNIKTYPFTFYVSGQSAGGYMLQSIVNCTVINGYKGVGACLNSGEVHEMMTLENVKGTYLATAAEAYNQADVGTWKNMTVNNKYWINAGAGLKRAAASKLNAYTLQNTVGLILGDLEWTEFSNLKISGCKIGIQIVKGKRIEFAGSLYDVTIENCATGLQVDDIDTRWGMLVARGSISGSSQSIKNSTGGTVKLSGVSLSGATSGTISRDDTSLSSVSIEHDRKAPKPAARLSVITADKTGNTDISSLLQSELTAMGNKGGGVVYLPAGKYLVKNPVTVPAGVELRGSSSVATREQSGLSKGTLIYAQASETANPDDSEALVTLAGTNSGIRGIRFIYQNNNFLNGVKKYGYTIRGKASGIYAVNIGMSASYNGIDFRGCNSHLIKKVVAICYNNAIWAGGSGGMIEGCLQNGNMLYRNGCGFAGWPSDESKIWAQLFDPITRQNTDYIKISGASGQTVLNCFAYGVRSLIVSEGSTNSRIVNIGADNIGNSAYLLRTSGGSMTVVNMMRYNGKSYTNSGTSLKIYNRLTINDKNEKTV